ncbi:hypothetical protein [Prochlorococcus marinus]|uniref:Uncharacterized protein n=1 Tax=Prochlorococcus marinus (strain MIT 9211) TaxID=93059 RepID=A9BC33_PROM4|nr:hypothetical protein [Prochlorococcus marinus]ABX09395.1 Hypothetical protein P9211_14641 [Prochlorococcus marinus str. MIT 9211]
MINSRVNKLPEKVNTPTFSPYALVRAKIGFAYRCFMRTEMDVLVLENQILFKIEQPRVEKDESWMQEFELD